LLLSPAPISLERASELPSALAGAAEKVAQSFGREKRGGRKEGRLAISFPRSDVVAEVEATREHATGQDEASFTSRRNWRLSSCPFERLLYATRREQ